MLQFCTRAWGDGVASGPAAMAGELAAAADVEVRMPVDCYC